MLVFLDKMLYILVLCRVLLIDGVQTLTIDSQLGTSIEDCFERISIGEQLPTDAIYRNVSELTTRECEQLCKQDKKCQAYDYGVGAKGNATCNLSTLDEKTIKENNPLRRHPDYDVYIRRFQCEQSPPTPIQTQNDDPESGPAHRPVFRPTGEERPLDDYLISADLGYRPPPSPDRPDDISNTGPDDAGPSYGDHRPQEIPYRPNRPNDKFRPEKPNKPFDRPYDRPKPGSNDILQFQDIGKPRPEYYQPERPDYHYFIRPNRKPRPDYEGPANSYGQPGPVGPPNRPYRPERPYEKPVYNYNSQYASNYGQNSYNDNSIYVEINDPPRPYVPIKDRPNQQYYGQGYLGYGTYLNQNSYSQNNQYTGSITEIGFDQNRPQKPGYGLSNKGYGNTGPDRPINVKPSYGSQDYGSNQGGYGSSQGSYGSNQSGYGSNQGSNGSNQVSYNKGSSSSQNSYNQGNYGQKPSDSNSNYGETGYGPKPDKPNQTQNVVQNSQKGSFASTQQNSQSYYGSQASYESYRPPNNEGYQKPQKPNKPYGNQDYYGNSPSGYGSSQSGYGSNQSGYGSNQSGYHSGQSGYGSNQYYGENQVSHNQNVYGSSYGSNQGNYGSNQAYGGSSGYGTGSYGSYGQGYGPQGSTGSNLQSGYGGSQNGYGSSQSGYGSSQSGYGSSQSGYGNSQSGYGISSSHSQTHGESQYAEHSSYYQGYENRPYRPRPGYNDRPDYDNRPDYDDRPGYGQRPDYGQTGYGEKPSYTDTRPGSASSGYGQKPDNQRPAYGGTGQNDQSYGGDKPYGDSKPGYGDTKPGYGDSKPGYGDTKPSYGDTKPSYGDTKPGYGDTKPGYGDTKPGYGDTRPGYGDTKPGYVDTKPGYGDTKPGYGDTKPGYGDTKPGYGNSDPSYTDKKPGYGEKPNYENTKPNYENTRPNYTQSYRPDVRPVYEYELDKPANVPAYIAKPGGEVVTSRPVVIGDYERPGYKEPGRIYEACFKRVLAGQRALRSFVQRVVPCERLEDCRRECAEERRFHCESFNYRLDPSFRGKGLCELMTKPIESFDLFRDFVQDKDYDFYEVDRNSLEPNCPETLRGPGLLHSGFLSSKDKPNRPNSVEGWKDRNWNGFSNDRYKGGNRRYEDRFYVPYQIGLARTDDDQDNKWGQYGGIYGGSSYYKNRNDYHKSINYWGLTSERPTFVKPYYIGVNSHYLKEDFDYDNLGKDFEFKRDKFDWTKDRTTFDHRVLGKDDHVFGNNDNRFLGKDFDYHSLGKDGKEYHLLGEDFYGFGKQRYGSGSWRRWNSSGITNVIDFDDHSLNFYDSIDRSEEPGTKDCFSRRKPGMSLNSGAIRRSLIAGNVLACEAACFGEKEFKCVSYSYRYSNSQRTDNCFLSERQFHGLSLSADSGSDVYAMPQDHGCSTVSHTPWIESECFYHVRSDTAVSGPAVKATLTVAGLGACEAECIRAQGFFCRGFSFRFDPPTDDSLNNCILTSSPPTSLSGGESRGHELYARGNYGRGCEPTLDVRDDAECYLQYDKAAKLTPSATRGLARVDSEKACSNICNAASFKCLSFSYNNNAAQDTDNCLLSEIRLFDLQRDVDYVHSENDWLFAFDLFNEKCWKKVYSDQPTFEVPHPIIHTSSEEDDSFLPLPPSSGSAETSYIPGSGFPSTNYSPEKPYYPSTSSEIHYPIEPRPGTKPGYKPFRPNPEPFKPYRPESSQEGPFRPPDRESYRPFRPDNTYGLKPEAYPKPDSFKPSYRPEPFKPSYRPEAYPKPDGYRPGSGFEERPSYLPGDKRPGFKPGLQGDREGGPATWRHYTVSGFPCRSGTVCAQNVVAGHWACEPEGGEIGSWDYCCAPSHRCGYSEGFHKPWCYVGQKEDQWRPCSEKYYPYHQHNVPHPSQGQREDSRPSSTRPHPTYNPDYIPHWDKRPGPYLSAADKKYWDDLYENGPKAYYDKYGNPLPGYSRVPMENRPRIKNRYNNRPGGSWAPVNHEDPGVPGLGAPRYWPVAYLHKGPPPNMTYFRYNESKPTTTTEKYTTTPPLSRELPSEPRIIDQPNDLDAKSSRDDKKINITDDFNKDLDRNNRNNTKDLNYTTETIPVEEKVNTSEVDAMKTESYRDLDKIDGIDDKLDDFSKSLEVLNIEDVKGDKIPDLKTLEAEERQIEAIGRLLAARRGNKLVLEKRSQKELETKHIAVDKDVDFDFGNKFPTPRAERRGVIKRISKDEIERDRNIDKSLEVSETTFVRPPRVLSTTENIRKAIVNGKVFYDATVREQRDLFNTSNRDNTFVTKSFRNQRDIITTRRPYFKRLNESNQESRSQRIGKNLRFDDTTISNKNVQEVRRPKISRLESYTLANLRDYNSTNERNRKELNQNPRHSKSLIFDGTTTEKNINEEEQLQNSTRKNNSSQNTTREENSKKRLEESSTPSIIGNNNFGKRKTLIARNVNPVRRVRRVYRKRYNPEEVRKRLLERDRNKTSTEPNKVV